MLHGFLSFFDSFARLRDLLLDRRYFITGLLGAVLFVSSFFSPSFRWKGDKRSEKIDMFDTNRAKECFEDETKI